jgi:hypothetical protein
MLKAFKKSLAGWARYQWTDMSGVKPEFRQRENLISLNSEAGTIDFRPRKVSDLCSFRDRYLNRFETLAKRAVNGDVVTRDLFDLYDDIRKAFRVRYRANLRTRVRSRFVFI